MTIIKANNLVKVIGSSYDDKITVNTNKITIDPGKGDDIIVVTENSREVTIENFEVNNLNEKIDISNFKNLYFSDLQIEQAGDDVLITIKQDQFNIDILLKGLNKDDLSEDNFLTENIEPDPDLCNSFQFIHNFEECCFYEHPYICSIPLIIGSSAVLIAGISYGINYFIMAKCYSTPVSEDVIPIPDLLIIN